MDLAIIIYCLVCVGFYLYDGFRIVRNKPELVRKPSWIILTFLVMWLSPVFMPFVAISILVIKIRNKRDQADREDLDRLLEEIKWQESAIPLEEVITKSGSLTRKDLIKEDAINAIFLKR